MINNYSSLTKLLSGNSAIFFLHKKHTNHLHLIPFQLLQLPLTNKITQKNNFTKKKKTTFTQKAMYRFNITNFLLLKFIFLFVLIVVSYC